MHAVSSDTRPTDTAGPTILVVAPSPGGRDVVAQLLEDAGYRVCRAEDGMAALLAVEADPVDLVLADMTMSRLDGVILARLLRTREHAVPVVLMGAAAPGGLLDVPFVRKPFALEQLTHVIAAVLTRNGYRGAAGGQG
jgi:CheY-like chemotaxis protein